MSPFPFPRPLQQISTLLKTQRSFGRKQFYRDVRKIPPFQHKTKTKRRNSTTCVRPAHAWHKTIMRTTTGQISVLSKGAVTWQI